MSVDNSLGGKSPIPKTERDANDKTSNISSRSSSVTSREFRSRDRSARVDMPLTRHSYTSSGAGDVKLQDESRISKFLRKILNERNDKERRLYSLRQLLDYVNNYVDNKKTVISNCIEICEAMFVILKDRIFADDHNVISSVVASVVHIMQYDCDRPLSWLRDKLINTKSNKEKRFSLSIYREILERDKKLKCLQRHIKELMPSIQNILENSDEEKMFQAITEVILLISNQYSEAIMPHFSDMCDVLIGWNIDANDNESMLEYTRSVCLKLSPFFCTCIDKSVDYMLYFVDDINTYVKNLEMEVETDPTGNHSNSIKELLEKSCALLRMFSIFAECLEENLENTNKLLKTANTICVTVKNLKRLNCKNDFLYLHANNCIRYLIKYSSDELCIIDEIVLEYVREQSTENLICFPLIHSFLLLIAEILKKHSTKLSIEYLEMLIGPNSTILKFRELNDNACQDIILKMYKYLLTTKSVPILTKTYLFILSDLEQCLNIMAKYDNMEIFHLLSDYNENQYNQNSYNIVDAESLAIFYFYVLHCLASMKNNLLMFALEPSLFNLFTKRLRLTDSVFLQFYPDVTASAFHTLFKYCSTHEYFISSSDLSKTGGSAIYEAETSLYFPEMLNFISVVLKSPKCSYEIRRSGLIWIRDIIKFSSKIPEILKNEIFVKVLYSVCYIAMDSNCENTVKECGEVLQAVFKQQISFPASFLNNVFDLCIIKSTSINSEINECYNILLKILPIDIYIMRNVEFNKNEYGPIMENIWKARRNVMIIDSAPNFDQNSFKGFMNYILYGKSSFMNGGRWLTHIFNAAIAQQDIINTNKLSVSTSGFAKYDGIKSFLWFWATWQCANYCLTGKLKTPLGRANETILSLETIILDLAKELQEYGKCYPLYSKKHSHSFEPSDDIDTNCRVILLLQFIEQFEKLVYNAAEGTAVAIVTPIQTVRNFFRTNRQVCDDWLNRIRLHVIHIALAVQEYSLVVRHGFVLLNQFEANNKYNVKEFEDVVLMTAFALAKLKSPQMIQGLNIWSRKNSKIKFPWLKAFTEYASGRLEDSALNFELFLTNYIKLPTNVSETERNNLLKDPDEEEEIGESINSQLDNINKTPNANLISVLTNLTADIYCELGSWQELDDWCKKLKKLQTNYTDDEHISSSFNFEIDINSINALAKFEGGEFRSAFQTAKESINFEHGIVFSSWNYKQITNSAMLQHVISSIANSKDDSFHHAKICTMWSQHLLNSDALKWPLKGNLAALQHLHFMNFYSSNGEKHGTLKITENFQLNTEKVGFESILMPLWILKQTGDFRDQKCESNLSNLMQVTARLARRQHCVNLARELLSDFIHNILPDHVVIPNTEYSFSNLIDTLRDSWPSLQKKTYLVIEREAAKLYYVEKKYCKSIYSLSSALRNIIREKDCSELIARSLLSIVKWTEGLRLNGDEISNDIEENLQNLVCSEDLSKTYDIVPFLNKKALFGDTDLLTGSLLRLSCLKAPNLGKTWINFATWCLKEGRRLNEFVNEGKVELTPEECMKIRCILPIGISEEDADKVVEIISYVQTSRFINDEEISEQYMSLTEDPKEVTRRQLLNCSIVLQTASDGVIDRLIETWVEIRDRIYHPYLLAVHSYGSFLKLRQTDADSMTTTTLRLLRLLVKHVSELRHVLEPVFESSPTSCWLSIVPQLFSRLNHPDPIIRQIVSNLISRIAKDFPHLIVYPAIVGHTAASVQRLRNHKELIDKYMSQDEAEEGDLYVEDDIIAEDRVNTLLQHCFGSIVNTLSTLDQKMVSEVETFVRELRRITLLWDELWNGTLTQYQNDMDRRFKHLEVEIKSVFNNNDLTESQKHLLAHQKHIAILKPTIFILENLYELTSKPPETPHEQLFRDTYLKDIENALLTLKNPPDISSPSSCWKPFKQIQAKMVERSQRRSSLLLKMNKLSNYLGSIKNSSIPIPGLSYHEKPPTIVSIEKAVNILPTKTKPKKLMFISNDGKRRTFLFKGLEDMHLDERIMQLISIVNNMFAKINRTASKKIYAKHYSVTPLGARSGLIEWVEGATPIFALYKKWQHRELMASALKNNEVPATQLPRPSDMYFNKLKTVFESMKLDPKMNRKDWPKDAKISLLKQLIKETPSDLLSKELWCNSTSADEWLHVVKSFNCSMALMSVIGYIIGLGDRHLDNILVDLNTGDVVHIDYNVCFEKGKNLRIPENVPFRMTHNLQTALGVTGVEGKFRLTAEMVMRVLRRGKETLLTLLEAFLYDPLVDWTVGNETGYQGALYGGAQNMHGLTEARRRKTENDRFVAVSFFQIRLMENKAAWNRNREIMLSSFKKIVSKVSELELIYVDLEKKIEEEKSISEQLEYVDNATSDRSHPLHTLIKRYKEYKNECNMKDVVLKEISNKYTDIQQLSSSFLNTLQILKSNKVDDIIDQLKISSTIKTNYLYVQEFLVNAGQKQLLLQGQAIENQVRESQLKRKSALEKSLNLLSNYAIHVPAFANALIDQNSYLIWTKYFKMILDDFSVSNCEKIGEMLRDQYEHAAKHAETAKIALAMENTLSCSMNMFSDMLQQNILKRQAEPLGDQILKLHEKESIASIRKLINENLAGDQMIFIRYLINHLGGITQKLRVIESEIFITDDNVNFMTKDGDWLIDHHFQLIHEALKSINLINLLNPKLKLHNNLVEETSSTFNSVHMVLIALQEMNEHFASIITPEAIKCLSNDETAFHDINIELIQLLKDIGGERTINELKNSISQVLLGRKSAENLLRKVKEAYKKFIQLVSSVDKTITNKQGQMVIVVFHGLFERVFSEWYQLIDRTSDLRIPHEWYWFDVAYDSKALQVYPVVDLTRELIRLLWFVEELSVMVNFLNNITEIVESYSAKRVSSYTNELQLEQPIRCFISKFLRQQMLGFSTQMISHYTVSCISTSGFDVLAFLNANDIGTANRMPLNTIITRFLEMTTCVSTDARICLITSHIQNINTIWRRIYFVARIDKNIKRLQDVIERTKCYLIAIKWQNHNLFHNYSSQISHILTNLQMMITNASLHQNALNTLYENWNALDASIVQRLKWACGANTNLQSTLQYFQDAAETRRELMKSEDDVCQYVIGLCKSIIQLEQIRNGGEELLNQEKINMHLLNKVRDVCLRSEHKITMINPIESKLMQLLNENEKEEDDFIKSLKDQLNSAETKLHENNLEDVLEENENLLKIECDKIKQSLKTFHQLISFMNNSLKAVSKLETLTIGRKAKAYIEKYKKFSSEFTSLLRILVKENPSNDMETVKKLTKNVKDILPEVYDDLYKMEMSLPVPNDILIEDSIEKDDDESTIDRIIRDPKTGKTLQERNSYATSVWCRVKQKLDGKDPDINQKLTTTEQVDHIIKAATNIENLSELYEGWTPWI